MKSFDGWTAEGVQDILRRFRSARAWVVGDLMLDEYCEGVVRRISPEAPVQVVNVERTFHRAGGAANVAHGIAALGGKVDLCGLVGQDEAGEVLLGLCAQAGIGAAAVKRTADRPTTRKVRVLAQHQQILRMDWERSAPVPANLGEELRALLDRGEAPGALVLSDYAKGLFTPPVLRTFLEAAQARGVPALVDPKLRDFTAYRGASVITPNLRELEMAADKPLAGLPDEALAEAARALLVRADIGALVVTLAERGMLVVPRDGPEQAIPAAAHEVFDVTGAGDTVIATLALGLAAGVNLATAARLSNAAAGIVVGKVGTAVVSPEELFEALLQHAPGDPLGHGELAWRVEAWRAAGKRVVFTNGCFDLLHVGHVKLLREAARHGDVLVVGINSDASVERLKGADRPLVGERERAGLLAALDCVDAVAVFTEDTPLSLIELVQPDVLVKGGDYAIDQVVGRREVEARGGRVELVPLVSDRSTSALIDRIRKGDKP